MERKDRRERMEEGDRWKTNRLDEELKMRIARSSGSLRPTAVRRGGIYRGGRVRRELEGT